MANTIIWNYYDPKFEFFENCNDFTWYGHTFFAYDLIRNLKPKVVVELGTYKGTSFSSMIQAAKDENLDTTLFAVDSWSGDDHTGFYSESIYNSVVENVRKYYPKQNVRLLRKLFDEALLDFEDHSIDVLHIDGLHTYVAVKNDYETWKSKVKQDGVILFHDTNVPDFGVWQLWKEIKIQNPNAMFIEHRQHFGLGVMLLDKNRISFGKEHGELIRHYEEKANNSIGSMDLITIQADRDQLLFENMWLKGEVERFAKSTNENWEKYDKTLQELNEYYDRRGKFYSDFLEIYPDKGIDQVPDEQGLLATILHLENHINHLNHIIMEKDTVLNRRAVKLVLKQDKNRIAKKALRGTKKVLGNIKRIIKK